MIRCIKFRSYTKNTLRGFVDLELTRVGLIIRDCTWHESAGKEWIGFPAKSFEGREGKTQWTPLVEFSEGAGEARRIFQAQAIAAVHEAAAKEESAS